MFTTAGAARSTASAYEAGGRGNSAGVDAAGALVGMAVVGALTGGCDVGAGAPAGGAARRAMSSGRSITAMNAAASPITAEAEMKPMIRSRGRVVIGRKILKIYEGSAAFSAFRHVYNAPPPEVSQPRFSRG
jgi:hypothetical protein